MIRSAELADLTALGDIELASFGDSWSMALLMSELTASTRIVVVDDQLRGYASAAVAGDVADLMRIAVVPQARRLGLGRALLADVTERVRAAGATRLLLEVAVDNLGAQAFYATEGFACIDRRERYYPNGADALVYARPLH